MSTFLDLYDIEPDNNSIEIINRKFVSIRDDGGGNRTEKGMEANSILFSIYATDCIRGVCFYDHITAVVGGYVRQPSVVDS